MANNYSFVDKALHQLAFATPRVQIEMADLENKLFSKSINPIKVNNPVFITGLPRAGSTLLLELCIKQGEFATHQYRDMPFVLLPLIWDRISKSFRKKNIQQTRAHGDGMLIDYDSPEAFEEMIWKHFWNGHYQTNHIIPWDKKNHAEFCFYFNNHMKKIISLKQGHYISKNNGNIARASWILDQFPKAKIIIPFRNPLQQASSLLRQHMNFLEIHKKDSFAKKYMAAIGHFDFGENCKPINFNNWLDNSANPLTLHFWLQYWLAAYSQLATLSDKRVEFICFEHLCAAPQDILEKIANFLELEDPDKLRQQSNKIHMPPQYPPDHKAIGSALLGKAEKLYQTLSYSK